jgi:hypothetical protein
MKNEKIYAKYPHIIKGSIESVQKGTIIKCGKNHELTSHGKICVIKCADIEITQGCKKTRIINIQDAKQVTRCKFCTRNRRNIRRRREKK